MPRPLPGTLCRTLTEAYNSLGIMSVGNIQTAWSVQNGETVVLTLWSDGFTDTDRRVYEMYDPTPADLPLWKDKPQNRRRIEHLKYVQAHLGGIFDSIVIFRHRDKDGSYGRIIRREIGPKMRLLKFNEVTGQYRAEQVAS